MKTSRSPEATSSGSSTTATPTASVGKSPIVQMHRAGSVQRKPATGDGHAQGGAAGGGAPAHAGSGSPGAATDANTPVHEPHGAKLQHVNQRLQVIAERKMQAQHDKDPSGGGDVQRKASGSAEPGAIHAAAERGTAGASTALPHAGRIQQAFGSDHDVSGIQAHVGGDATAACEDMGASAFASGDHVAFAGAPDLHTAAHEAAHVVQQRAGVSLYGGVGAVGDAYEAHADAVADRVVAGESAADLLSGGPGGTSGGVQRKAVQQRTDAGGGGGSAVAAGAAAGAAAVTAGAPGATAATPGKKERISIESKAWIPHAKVVDPEEPIRISNWLDTIDSLVNTAMNTIDVGGWFGVPLTPRLKYEFKSRYRGDGHTGYAGSSRAHHKVEFDWDGTTISGVTSSGRAEATHRDYSYHAWLQWGPFSKDVVKSSGTETGPAAGGTTGTAAGSHYDMNISAPNLLVITYAPPIDAHYKGTISGSTLNINWSTDNFPSHGYEVKKNGSPVQTSVVNDASWVPGEGPVGAAMIGAFLSLQTNNGSATVSI